jgi:hypothetical protein
VLALTEPGTLVSGVFALDPLAEAVSPGVPVEEPLFAFEAAFAAFSASRFCLEADGGILLEWWTNLKIV